VGLYVGPSRPAAREAGGHWCNRLAAEAEAAAVHAVGLGLFQMHNNGSGPQLAAPYPLKHR